MSLLLLLLIAVLVVVAEPVPKTIQDMLQEANLLASAAIPVQTETFSVAKEFASIVDIENSPYALVTLPLRRSKQKPNFVQHSIFSSQSRAREARSIEGYRPMHLTRAMRPTATAASCASQNRRIPRTIFGPDDRFSFVSQDYPYSAIGRLQTSNNTICTGTMIAKNLVLTASHCIPWGLMPDIWISYSPMYYEGEKPFGEVYATNVYAIYRMPEGDIEPAETAFDMAILQLESDLGNVTGWAGARSYQTRWNEGPYWINVGYPVDCFGAQRPVVSFNGTIIDAFAFDFRNTTGYYLDTRIDIRAGHSGGPIFSYFGNDTFISVVGVTSGENTENNSAAGGPALLDLINFAKEQAP